MVVYKYAILSTKHFYNHQSWISSVVGSSYLLASVGHRCFHELWSCWKIFMFISLFLPISYHHVKKKYFVNKTFWKFLISYKLFSSTWLVSNFGPLFWEAVVRYEITKSLVWVIITWNDLQFRRGPKRPYLCFSSGIKIEQHLIEILLLGQRLPSCSRLKVGAGQACANFL